MFPDGGGEGVRRQRFRSAQGILPVSSLRGAFQQDGSGRVKVQRGLRLNMANNPKKVKDPTEVALSAIQKALNISAPPASDNSRGSVRMDAPSNASTTADYNDSFEPRAGADRQMFEPIEEPRSS